MQNLIAIFIILILFSLAAGILASKKDKNGSHPESFFLGGRSLRWPLLFMTLLGTQVGGGFILGASDACYKLGIMGSMYNIGLSIGMLLLGLGIASRLRRMQINTISDIFETRYQSPKLKYLSGIFSILSMGGILIALAIGLRKFLFSMGIENQWMFLVAWLSVIGYTTHGGFLAVVWTDCVQAIGMCLMLLISFLWIIAPRMESIFITGISSSIQFNEIPFSALIIPILFMLIEQDMAQRAFSAKTEKDATKACLITALALLLLTCIPASFGLLARNIGIQSDGGSIFIQVAKQCAPEWVFLASAAAVLLAILSTASSVLLAVSSNAVQDIKPLSTTSPKKMTFWIGILAAIVSYAGTDIISWIVISYEVSVYTLFIPLMIGLYTPAGKICSERSAFFSVVSGGIAFLTLPLWSSLFQSQLPHVLIPLTASALGYSVSDALSKSQKQLG
ncbi:MAG: hypothetical protein QRY74_05530 [Chlamydia sp.]